MDIFTLQGGKCKFCSETLLLEKEIQLDHDAPKSRFPELSQNINNLQWSCFICNQAKRDLTSLEYIEHCKKVAMAN